MNRLLCKNCDTIIESTSQYDFKRCGCGKCFVDGGPGVGSRVGCENIEYVFLMPTYDKEENEKSTQKMLENLKKHEANLKTMELDAL